MKKAILFLSGFFLMFASRANAQGISADSPLAEPLISAAGAGNEPDVPRVSASAILRPSSELPGVSVPSPNSPSLSQAGVQGVFPNYSFQSYAGYTFVREYALPSEEVSGNGFDLSVSYYHKAGHIALEGALTTTFGSIGNQSSNFLFFGGGPRFRWAAPRGIDVWAHGLVGDAHFAPRLSGFGQNAFGYELGGGLDINAHLQRFAYRLEADMVGTCLFDTSRYSPKFSVGIVYKF